MKMSLILRSHYRPVWCVQERAEHGSLNALLEYGVHTNCCHPILAHVLTVGRGLVRNVKRIESHEPYSFHSSVLMYETLGVIEF